MINFLTIFMFISVFFGMYLFTYIINNGNTHYMKYLAVLILCVNIYIFGYIIELHSNSLDAALFWNWIQCLAIPLMATLWLIMVLFYIGIIKKANSRIIPVLFIIPAITYIMRWTNSMHYLYYSGYTFTLHGEVGILELDKGPWYYFQRGYEGTEIIFVILIFLIYSFKVSADERLRYRLLSLITVAESSTVLLIIFDPKDLGLDYTAILFPIPIFMVAYLIAKQDFFEIRSTARNRFFYQSNEAMIILNDKNRIIDYNLKAIKFFKESGIELTNADLNIFHDENSELIDRFYSNQVEIYKDTFNGEFRYWEISSNTISIKDGKRHGIIKNIRDITAGYSANKHLEQMAKIDELTQLSNRREFNEMAEKLIKQSYENDTSLIILMFDIDYFKNINDTFGHQNGDIVLKRIAKEARANFRNDDLLARIGGEEFVALLPGISESKARFRAEEYRKRIADLRIIKDDPDYQITISIGMAVYEKRMTLEELINSADKALYEAKDSGRNKVIRYYELL